MDSSAKFLPRYRQIALVLEDRISSGQYQPGELLPSETTLMKEFGVSLATCRKALKVVVDRGLVVSRHGIGTFIAEDPVVRVQPDRLGAYLLARLAEGDQLMLHGADGTIQRVMVED